MTAVQAAGVTSPRAGCGPRMWALGLELRSFLHVVDAYLLSLLSRPQVGVLSQNPGKQLVSTQGHAGL